MVISKKILISILFSTASLSCIAQPMEGFVRMNSQGIIRLYTAHHFEHGDEIKIQYPDKNGSAVCCALAHLKKPKPIDDDIVSDELSEKEVNAYEIFFDVSSAGRQPFIGMAVIGTSFSVKNSGADLYVQSARGGSLMRTCLGNEGVHLLRSENSKLSGHLYLSLGYDVRPTCPKSILSGK